MPTFFYGNQEGLLNSEPLFYFTVLIQVDLHQCHISSTHIAALSALFPRGLQSLTLGRFKRPTLIDTLFPLKELQAGWRQGPADGGAWDEVGGDHRGIKRNNPDPVERSASRPRKIHQAQKAPD